MDESEDSGDPRVEGRCAAERSEGPERNPQPQGTEAHRLWQEGHASVTAPDAVADRLADFA